MTVAALILQQLKKTYKNGVEALNGIDLSIEKGDFFALLGANGAGKSTTIGLITTLLNKTAGKIYINGYDLDTEPRFAKARLGVVPQEINLNIFETCEQTLLHQAGYYGIPRQQARPYALHLLDQLGLINKKTTCVRHLSGGMKRRLMIARALVHRPNLLILDEPTAGVDIEIRHSIWKFLRTTNQDGTTIILTTHYLEEAEQLCKNVAIIHNGTIIENTSIKKLLQTIKHQTFLFNTVDSFDNLPNLEPLQVMLIDHNTFEIRIDTKETLNEVFAILTKNNVRIHSMRNKTNRLEELFLDLINHER